MIPGLNFTGNSLPGLSAPSSATASGSLNAGGAVFAGATSGGLNTKILLIVAAVVAVIWFIKRRA